MADSVNVLLSIIKWEERLFQQLQYYIMLITCIQPFSWIISLVVTFIHKLQSFVCRENRSEHEDN